MSDLGKSENGLLKVNKDLEQKQCIKKGCMGKGYSDQQNCPNVWYLSMVLKITYELPQMETNCECMNDIH